MTYITSRIRTCSTSLPGLSNLSWQAIFPVLLVMLFSLWLSSANASDLPKSSVTPGQQDLQELLSGNSIEGTWDGRPYQQYFSRNGSTVYQETGNLKRSGRWRIDSHGEYCSVWPPFSHEACYQVRVLDRTIYWKSSDTYYPATIIEGDIFNQ